MCVCVCAWLTHWTLNNWIIVRSLCLADRFMEWTRERMILERGREREGREGGIKGSNIWSTSTFISDNTLERASPNLSMLDSSSIWYVVLLFIIIIAVSLVLITWGLPQMASNLSQLKPINYSLVLMIFISLTYSGDVF